jgi:hypothetical protein
MPRTRRRPQVAISLFPFLGVLASVIGTMTLVIAALAAGQVETSEGTAEAKEVQAIERRAAEYARLGKEAEDRLGKVRDELAEGHAALRAELAAPPPVKVLQVGTGKNLKPVFIEVDEKGLLVKARPPLVPRPLDVRRRNIPDSEALAKLLAQVPKEKPTDHIIIFLIRPSGVQTYLDAEFVADRAGARHGKLPVPGLGRLDLSDFEGAN